MTTGAGLDATIIVDRACDVYSLRWHGLPLGFYGSPGPGRAAPSDQTDQAFLRTFSGFMVTCGLRNVGPAAGSEGLHGRIARAQADEFAVTSQWESDTFSTCIVSRHREAMLFGANLELERTWRVKLGAPEIVLSDRVTNSAFRDEPVLLLYHLNLGFPVISAATTLTLDADPTPRDAVAAVGLDAWSAIGPPVPDFAEQVFFFEGASRAIVEAPQLGCRLVIEWDADDLPFEAEWKDLAAGIYAVGIEPGTCHPIGREQAIANGQGRLLVPGESFTTSLRLTVVSRTGFDGDRFSWVSCFGW